MQLAIKQEHRAIVAKHQGFVTDIPRSTAPHIVARLTQAVAAFCEKRSLLPSEERAYSSAAAAFAGRRPQVDPIHAQIADWNRRPQVAAKRTAVSTTIDRRHGVIALKYKALSYDQIKRAVALNYDEDTLNRLNLAELGKSIRFEQGQTADPSQSLRDAVKRHRALAARAKSMDEFVAHHKAGDEAEKKLKG